MQRTLAHPKSRLRSWLGASFSAAALALAGCGGGGDDSGADAADVDITEQEAAELETDATEQAMHGGWRRCEHRVNNTQRKLLECVTVQGVRRHLQALQDIADANNGHRASGSSGYDQSAAYAERVLRNAGYVVTRQEFQFQTFVQLSPVVLEQTAPAPGGPIDNHIMSYSGSGDVTAAVSVPSGAVTGCTAADFAGFPAGHIALVQRGDGCPFALKATNAHAAGAVGVVIYNNLPEELNGTLGADFTLDLPVTSVTLAVGEQLAATAGLVLHLKTDTFRGLATTSNVIAESRHGDPTKVVMVGAHLDSVNEGPGINDNGTGAAGILETAVQMGKVRPRNKVRFALWGAEESGLVGATHYVANLTQDEKDRIALYLNFDMIGSPNHAFMIYDGDDSDAEGAGPGPGRSDEIEKLFERFYTRRGIAFKGTDFSGRSDYGPFMDEGISSGGLFTGAEEIKTEEEVALWGGTAGVAYDPCYHQACDTMNNVNWEALGINADAVAYSTLHYAMERDRKGGKRVKQGHGKFSAANEVLRRRHGAQH
ncbi:M28 family metallopeptidase [Schlegelella sp. S2-27]|uniref:M28 family metallopeptidase n=1 Tax=Caldimonas mangrovi TaxID=2944811 RepID=A0ABT0YS28_9BURK|nr:M28 family metallopeptidase [Caldimonas mangrovi]MCM5681547.1 M28 family metallopeptidase [Caldimonas mangrovi]